MPESNCGYPNSMSQYNSMPIPGAYVPPNQNQGTPPPQGYGAQHQQGVHPQSQAGTSAQGYKGSLGQMMNQAVTTSKPMLNKLSKTISSKLGNKPATETTPQHLQSYSNYQHHHGQQTHSPTPPQSYTFNPHAYSPQPPPPAPNTYTSQQSPHQQPGFGQGQGNYFAQQTPTTPQTPSSQATSPQPQVQQTYQNSGTHFGQGLNPNQGQQVQTQVGHQQQQYLSSNQGQTQGHYYQQPLYAESTGQQMGVVGGTQHLQSPTPQSPQVSSASPQSPAPQQTQWHSPQAESEKPIVSAYQSPPPVPDAHTQSYFQSTTVQHQTNNQQWKPLSPIVSEGTQSQIPPTSISPPPPSVHSHTPVLPSVSPVPSHNAAPVPQSEFIAELPADLDSLTFANTKPVDTAPAPSSGQTTQYKAYQSTPAPTGPSSPGFTIARRAVSISNAPYADPWRFADPLTELPTREFYVIADLLFDALDRKFEPQSTGLLEASKILRSWIDLTEDATRELPWTRNHGPILICIQNSSLINPTALSLSFGPYRASRMSWCHASHRWLQRGTLIYTRMPTTSS